MQRLVAVSFVLGFCLLAGCGTHNAGGDGGGGGASSGPTAADCPSTLFTAVTCGGEEVGLTCPGTTACDCAGRTVNNPTRCTCKSGHDGDAYVCDDDCTKACADQGSGGAGGGASSSTLSRCEAFLQADYTCMGQAVPDTATLEADCNQFEASCGSTFDDFMTCYASSTLTCDGGLPSVPGCDAQTNAFIACGSTM